MTIGCHTKKNLYRCIIKALFLFKWFNKKQINHTEEFVAETRIALCQTKEELSRSKHKNEWIFFLK
jgi:hypothetical protein